MGRGVNEQMQFADLENIRRVGPAFLRSNVK